MWKQVDDSGLLLKVSTGDYCEINEAGLLVWQHLDQQMRVDELAARVSVIFDATEQDIRQHVIDFARGLEEHGMLVFEEDSRASE